ncbi:hypothetical protein [uncultured Hymenobacter sp.]|uniref:hypothetical protein n=1 Tax=uncultured Hymenobacter sp. TaxID=170016 RepID=UPI0035CC4270
MAQFNSWLTQAAANALVGASLLVQRVPKPISPRAHAYFDLLVFPAIMGLAAWMWQRNRRAAMLIVGHGLLEGTTAAITNFPPPGPFPLISFRTHVGIGLASPPLFLIVSSLVPGIPWADRKIVLLFGTLPILVNGLSDTSKPR